MIHDSKTNFLYLSDLLPKMHPNYYSNLENTLLKNNIDFTFLAYTKDIWAVDYMPIQVNENKFVRFRYYPTYLTKYKKYIKTISDVDKICNHINLSYLKSDIILDGGNISRTTNKVIMTERVFVDNPHYEKSTLISKLYELLEVDKIFFIPELPGDFTGHSDGMVRFLDEHTLLINDYKKEKKLFINDFKRAIELTGLDCIRIPYCVYNNKSVEHAIGMYINYLQMENLILVPAFNMVHDDQVIRLFEQLFPNCAIESIESNEIAVKGGILNCITWNIKQ